MKNKVVIVTGARKCMGLASTKHLLTLGANIVMVFCSDDARAEYEVAQLSEYTDKIFLLKADIVSHDNRVRIIEKALTGFGHIDVLVNNVGIAPCTGFLNETEEEYDCVLGVNLKAPVFLAKLVVKQMIEQGVVVLLSIFLLLLGIGASVGLVMMCLKQVLSWLRRQWLTCTVFV